MYEDFVPELLAKLRAQKGVSARDMSLSLGQANNYINNIENKKSLPAMQSFFFICEYLGVTPQEFFDEENPYPTALQEFIEEGKKLDPKSMAYLLSIMKELNSKKYSGHAGWLLFSYYYLLCVPRLFLEISYIYSFSSIMSKLHCCLIQIQPIS